MLMLLTPMLFSIAPAGLVVLSARKQLRKQYSYSSWIPCGLSAAHPKTSSLPRQHRAVGRIISKTASSNNCPTFPLQLPLQHARMARWVAH